MERCEVQCGFVLSGTLTYSQHQPCLKLQSQLLHCLKSNSQL